MASTKKIEAVVLDLGRVVLALNTPKMFNALMGTERSFTDQQKIYEHWDFYDAFERGHMEPKAFQERVEQLVGRRFSSAKDFAEAWNAIFDGEISGIPPLLHTLKEKTRLYALSNANIIHMDYAFAHFPSLESFHQIFLSYKLGLRKPEPAIFQTLTQTLDLPPHKLLFVDDKSENVDGAKAQGWHAEACCHSSEQLINILNNYQIL